MKKGQTVFVYNSPCYYEGTVESVDSIGCVMVKKEFSGEVVKCSSTVIHQTIGDLVEQMEDDLQYLEYKIKQLKKGNKMFTRKVDYIEMIADENLFDEATIDKLLDAKTYLEPHSIDYTVSYIRGEADTISPSPYEIAKEGACLVFDKLRSFNVQIDMSQFSDLFLSIQLDAEKWEEQNWNMLIDADVTGKHESDQEAHTAREEEQM